MTQWWLNGEARRPALADKLADWQALALITGEEFVRGHDVLDFGPEYGLDAILLAHQARRYVIVDNAQDVLDHMMRLHDVGLIDGAEVVGCDGQTLAPFATGEFDLVLDFGSIDNTAKPSAAYTSVVRVLRKHGFLITTYANAAVLNAQPLNDGTIPIYPETLAQFLRSQGMWVRNRDREDQPRALLIAQKGGEPLGDCAWYKTGVCACPQTTIA